MARRLDFGDQFPSDTGDVPPSSKTLGMEERAYTIPPADTPTPVRPGVIRQAGPDLEQKPVSPLGRVVYSAIVVERVNDTDFWCLRQDGKRGIASYLSPNPGIYDELRLGTEVAIIEDQIPGRWHIISGLRRRQMYSMRLSNAAELTANNEIIVPLAIGMVTGNDADGVNAELNLKGPALYVTPLGDGEAVYEISFNVTVEYADETSSGKIKIDTTCDHDLQIDDEVVQTRHEPDVVYFDPNVGFRQEYGTRDVGDGTTETYSLMTLAVPPANPSTSSDYFGGKVLNIVANGDAAVNGRARWTRDPFTRTARINDVLHLGNIGLVGQPHTVAYGDKTGAAFYIGFTGSGVTTPVPASYGGGGVPSNSPANIGKHMIVVGEGYGSEIGVGGTSPAVGIGFSRQGMNGTIYYKDHSGTDRSFSVENGIIYEGYGLTVPYNRDYSVRDPTFGGISRYEC